MSVKSLFRYQHKYALSRQLSPTYRLSFGQFEDPKTGIQYLKRSHNDTMRDFERHALLRLAPHDFNNYILNGPQKSVTARLVTLYPITNKTVLRHEDMLALTHHLFIRTLRT